MFTVEIRINGSLINHIYGHNEGPSSTGKYQEDLYSYELYEVDSRNVRNGQVAHYRPDGINSLLVKILNNAEQQTPVNKKKK